jgi:hypothetical protein
MNNLEQKIVNKILRDMIDLTIQKFLEFHPTLEIHEIRIYGSYSPIHKKVEMAIKPDVRESGQMFLGASS